MIKIGIIFSVLIGLRYLFYVVSNLVHKDNECIVFDSRYTKGRWDDHNTILWFIAHTERKPVSGYLNQLSQWHPTPFCLHIHCKNGVPILPKMSYPASSLQTIGSQAKHNFSNLYIPQLTMAWIITLGIWKQPNPTDDQGLVRTYSIASTKVSHLGEKTPQVCPGNQTFHSSERFQNSCKNREW